MRKFDGHDATGFEQDLNPHDEVVTFGTCAKTFAPAMRSACFPRDELSRQLLAEELPPVWNSLLQWQPWRYWLPLVLQPKPEPFDNHVGVFFHVLYPAVGVGGKACVLRKNLLQGSAYSSSCTRKQVSQTYAWRGKKTPLISTAPGRCNSRTMKTFLDRQTWRVAGCRRTCTLFRCWYQVILLLLSFPSSHPLFPEVFGSLHMDASSALRTRDSKVATPFKNTVPCVLLLRRLGTLHPSTHDPSSHIAHSNRCRCHPESRALF